MILLKLKMDNFFLQSNYHEIKMLYNNIIKFISLYLLGEFPQLEDFPSFHISS